MLIIHSLDCYLLHEKVERQSIDREVEYCNTWDWQWNESSGCDKFSETATIPHWTDVIASTLAKNVIKNVVPPSFRGGVNAEGDDKLKRIALVYEPLVNMGYLLQHYSG